MAWYKANLFTDTSDATLNNSNQMLSGVTAYANDVKYTGNIATKVATDVTINGQAYEEETGDYGWKTNITVPAGYFAADTPIEKTFSEIFPAPETPATAGEMLLGYQAFNKSGQKLTGTMANNGAVTQTISTQGGTYTIPAGYHNGEGIITATLPTGTQGTPVATKGTVSNNSITVTPSATDTTGYIVGETKTGDAVTVSASELVSGSTTIATNTTTDVTNLASVVTAIPEHIPEEISTDAGMSAVLTAANVGKAYLFTGTTGTYVNGDLYIVKSDS